MKKLNPDSEDFIKWSENMMSSEGMVYMFMQEALRDVDKFYRRNKKTFAKRLLKKLERGGLEHGSPIYSQARIRRELQKEYLDIVGWKLLGKWNKFKFFFPKRKKR